MERHARHEPLEPGEPSRRTGAYASPPGIDGDDGGPIWSPQNAQAFLLGWVADIPLPGGEKQPGRPVPLGLRMGQLPLCS